MILVVDAGNSRIKWAFSIPSPEPVIEEEYSGSIFYDRRADVLRELLASTWSTFPPPERILVSNVGGDEVETVLGAWVTGSWQVTPEFVCARERGWGVVNAYSNPADLGVDRWACLVAAHRTVRSACCVVDCGTAVTVDGIDAGGHHIGGVILPGVSLMRRSLLDSTSRIRRVEGTWVKGLAANTGDAVASGIGNAVVGGIERALTEAEGMLGSPPVILLTGGDCDLVGPAVSRECRMERDLVLKGLTVMAGSEP